MTRFQIESTAGVVFGIYDGETEDEAFAAMVEDSGGHAVDCDGVSTSGSLENWIIREVTPRAVS